MLTFYKNKSQTFECKVEIEGADGNKARSRLIFSPKSDSKKIFFEGTVKAGTCEIEVPPLKDVVDNGGVVLEIIVDDTLFSPWESTYEIKEPVKIESVELTKPTKSVKMIEDNVTLKTEKPKVTVQSVKKETKNNNILRESASKKDKELVKKFLNEYKKEPDKKLIKEFTETYFEPKTSTIKWAKRVLNNTNTPLAKTLMYYYDN